MARQPIDEKYRAHRMQLYLRQEQYEYIKQQAEKGRRSMAEQIRMMLDVFERLEKGRPDVLKELV